MRQFKRSQRLGEQILRDVSQLLESEMAETFPGMVTFTRVRLTDDLRNAKVYYSYLGAEENRAAVEEFLMRERRRIRAQVGKNLRVRNIPEFDFKFDPSIEEGVRIEQLLNQISSEKSSDESDAEDTADAESDECDGECDDEFDDESEDGSEDEADDERDQD